MTLPSTRSIESRLLGYLVTDPSITSIDRIEAIVNDAISAGITAVQLRAKGWTGRQTLEVAHRLADVCRQQDVMFLVNDRPDIALICGADGVHLGVDDIPVRDARRLLGPGAIIGYSPESDEDRKQAQRDGADYLGIGPVFATRTKPDAGPALGLPAFRLITQRSEIPVIGIGGIDHTNARGVLQAGAVGVAIVSSVFLADVPAAAARELIEALR